MPAELLLNPQFHQGRLRHAAKEVLTGPHLQQAAVLNNEV
jgi:hypothetical protein